MTKVFLLVIYAFVAAIIGGITMNLIMMAYYAILVARFAVSNPTIDNVVLLDQPGDRPRGWHLLDVDGLAEGKQEESCIGGENQRGNRSA
jgi:hypothetical protein